MEQSPAGQAKRQREAADARRHVPKKPKLDLFGYLKIIYNKKTHQIRFERTSPKNHLQKRARDESVMSLPIEPLSMILFLARYSMRSSIRAWHRISDLSTCPIYGSKVPHKEIIIVCIEQRRESNSIEPAKESTHTHATLPTFIL